MTIDIITVRVGIKKHGANGFVFDIDTHTPIPFGLTDTMKALIRTDLTNAGVDSTVIEDAIDAYNKNSATLYGEMSSHMSLGTFFESATLFGRSGGPAPGPSPFDVSLSADGTNPNRNPCYLLYICEMDNWYFRAGNTSNEILEHVPPINNYDTGKEPIHHFPSYPTAHPNDRPSLFGVYVNNPNFHPHPDDNSFKGFNFNIHMIVRQANLHETPITIDPKIRNP